MQQVKHRHADLILLSARQNQVMVSMTEDARHRAAVGNRIADLRIAKGLTQPQLAEAAGISQPSLSAIETGNTVRVTAHTFIGLCRALETTWEFLWGGEVASPRDEAELVAIFRALEPPARIAVLQSARTVLAALSAPTRTAAEDDDAVARKRVVQREQPCGLVGT